MSYCSRDEKPMLTMGLFFESTLVPLVLLVLLVLTSCSDSLTYYPDEGSKLVNTSRRFTIDRDRFYKDGSEFRILGGSLHYFRVHPQYWGDRLLRLKAMGLNVVQTYVPWNLHQPEPDRLDFEENTFADLDGFLKTAQRLDLLVMLRPGPYICGEWDFGGFPAWILAVEPPVSLRTSDSVYLSLVDSWWDILLPRIFHYLYSEGGPIIMVQIENEYGSFGADKVYMEHLADKARFHLGEDVILYTTDGAVLENLQQGSLLRDDVYTSVDFPVEWDAEAAFKLQKDLNAPGKSPSLSSEFYTGWLTHWGEAFAHTDPEYTAAALDKLLRLNASVVVYMAHGGTNFGFSSGSNTGGTASDFEPDITSYDYDAPISEAGNCDSVKFKALRAVLSKYSSMPPPDPPPLPARRDYAPVKLEKLSSLFQALESISVPSNGVSIDQPCAMERVGQGSGFILYQTILPDHTKIGSILSISQVHDRAQVYVATGPTSGIDDVEAIEAITASKVTHVGTFERWSNTQLSVQLPDAVAVPGLQLSILVENMGRVNYGPYIYDLKGIFGGVFLDDVPVHSWTAYPIPLENFQDTASLRVHQQRRVKPLATPLNITRRAVTGTESRLTDGPSFYYGWLDVDEPADTFVSLRGWSKGVLFINGFNLGRFWPVRGPQCTLYIPAPLLMTGLNKLILLELDDPQNEAVVTFSTAPDFSCGSSNGYIRTGNFGNSY